MQSLEDFYANRIAGVHASLLVHPLAANYLSGNRVKVDGDPFTFDLALDVGLLDREIRGADIIHLFGVFDGSRLHIHTQRTPGPDQSPPGLYFTTINTRLLASRHKNNFGLYQDHSGTGLHLSTGLHIDHFFLLPSAPDGLGALAFGLCAITAFRAGLSVITLIGAGGVGFNRRHIGYKVWPKFGFDAVVEDSEVAGHASVAGCSTIQQIMAADPEWWETNGSQRLMTFDLAPGSRSWEKLLDYLHRKFC